MPCDSPECPWPARGPVWYSCIQPTGFLLAIASKEHHEPNTNLRDKLYTQVDGGIRALLTEMQQGKSERLAQYLEFSARFYRYSIYNQMLIYLQRPNATFVAGYHKWQEMGYQVAKGEKGIRILAPRPYRVTDEETHEERETIYFTTVSVFDASQLADLDERPLPLFFKKLEDNQQDLCAQLEQAMQQDGIQVGESELGLTQGYSAKGRVRMREGLDSTSKVLTLLHEYAHELLHWSVEGKAQAPKVKECHAEAVSFIVSHFYGVHNPFSADYLQHWGNTPQDLLAELEIVRRTAARIISRLEPSSSPMKETDTPVQELVVS